MDQTKWLILALAFVFCWFVDAADRETWRETKLELRKLRRFSDQNIKVKKPGGGRGRSVVKCADYNIDSCTKLKKYCRSQAVMKKHCKKTCGLCKKPVQKPCKDGHVKCPIIAKMYKGRLCKLYGKKLCRKSCGVCTAPALQCGKAPLNPSSKRLAGRIVGGTAAKPGYFPWQVGIYLKGRFHCGGALIDDTHFISAAHCFDGTNEDPKKMKIKVGDVNRNKNNEKGEQTFAIEKIVLHPEFVKKLMKNDIIVGKIKGTVRIVEKYVYPICLPDKDEDKEVGSMCQVSGWGKSYAWGRPEKTLLYIKSPVVDPGKCQKKNNKWHPVTGTNLCTGRDDGKSFQSACQGDSGGPLACLGPGKTWKLHGVVSWGNPRCDATQTYNVYTKVSKYIDWIEKNKP